METISKNYFLPANSQVDEKKADNTNQRTKDEKKLKKACADFESVFVYHMFKSMRQIIPKSDFLGKNHGKDVYEMMFDQKVAEEFSSKRGGLGLQKNILTQMERIMGKSKNDQKTLKK